LILIHCGRSHEEAAMSDLYWLSDEAWAAIERHLPHGQPGARRVDDRRVISGILHVLKSGCRWCDVPADYGPRTTLYNRYNRWARRGIWRRVFEQVAGAGEVPDELAIDATHIKVHRSAGGGKRGKRRKRSAARVAAARPKSTRWLTLAAGQSPSS
jgi:transposase